MKTKGAPAPMPESDRAITIHNRLYPGHRYRAAIDEVFRMALRGLPGRWDVTACPAGRRWFRIDVVSALGARWSMSVPVHEGPCAEDLADAIRAAGVRYSTLRGEHDKFRIGNAGEGAAGDRKRRPETGSQSSGITREPSPSGPEGMLK